MSLPLIYTAALTAVAALALFFGGWASRRACLFYFMAQVAAMNASGHHYRAFEGAFFLIDLALLGGLLWISLRSRVRWPVACTALQMVTVLGQAARISDTAMSRMTYYVLVQWTAWPALIILTIGIYLDRRAERT